MGSPSNDVSDRFTARYGAAPQVTLHVPGRGVFLGESLGTAHLPILGWATSQGIAAAAAPTSDGLVVIAAEGYEPEARFLRADHDQPITAAWQRTAVGVLHALADLQPQSGANIFLLRDLPEAAGLGTRAALATALTAAFLHAWGGDTAPETVVRLAVAAQRHAGFDVEPADFELILFAAPGELLRIDVAPPARVPLALPPGLTLAVATVARDHDSVNAAREPRDELIVGARIAAAMLADQVGLETGTPPRLADVAAVEVVEILVGELPERLSAREVARGVEELNVEHLVQLAAGRIDPQAKVAVRRIARHLLSEAERVEAAEAALRAGDATGLGALLDASHASLRDDAKSSSATVNGICAGMRAAGALGARVLGDLPMAVVALVAQEDLDAVLLAAAEAGAVETFASPPAGPLAVR